MQNQHNQRLEGKKILFLVTQSKYGGAQKYIMQLAAFFKKRNTVLIAVGEADHQDEQFFSEARAIGIEPIVLRSLVRNISLVKAFDALLEIRKLLYRERPDFLHINSSMAGAVGSCAAWAYRLDPLNKAIRVVYTAHGFVFNEPLPRSRLIFYRFVERISAGFKGAIITVSSYDREQAHTHKIASPAKMIVIHNGIDTATSFLSKKDARAELELPNGRIVIGTIAALYPTKGLQYFVEAAHAVCTKRDDATFILIGSGPEQKILTDQVVSLHLENRFMFREQSNAAKLITAFDLFVLPSVKEGFAYTLLEAGLAGVPIVATRVGGTPELITHGEHGMLVEPAKSDELASAILSVLQNPSVAARYAQLLQQRIRSNFSEEQMLSTTEELYLRFYQTPTEKKH